MKPILFIFSLLSILAFTSCGKGSNFKSSALSPAADEDCEGCTERGLNAPVGPQPLPSPRTDFDADSSNPRRSTLRFPEFDPRWGLTKRIYEKAVAYFEENKGSMANPRYFTVVDFNLSASRERFFLFDLSTGSVEKHAVAAGKNSDPGDSGFATHFSNEPESKMSSLGFYETLETYNGTHGLSLRLKGLSESNSNAESRQIVMHPATYVKDAVPHAGRSWGCTAIDPKYSASVISRVKGGSVILVDR
jgi:hypothetical protein